MFFSFSDANPILALFDSVIPLSSISPLLLYTAANGPFILHFIVSPDQNGFFVYST